VTSCSLVVVVASIRSLRSVSRPIVLRHRVSWIYIAFVLDPRYWTALHFEVFSLLRDYTIVVMVNKCCAVGCESGYTGHSPTPSDARITFHSFPIESVLYAKSGFVPTRGKSLYRKSTLACVLCTFETMTSWKSIVTAIQRGAKTCLAAS